MATNHQAIMFMRFSAQFSTITLLWYDYSLTWTREVKHFWMKPFKLSTALYILCRYGMVANVLYTLALANKLPLMSCDAGYRICSILSVLGRIGIITVWGARTYAVFNRSKIILIVFGTLGVIVIVFAVMHVPYVSCSNPSNRKEPAPNLLSIFTVIYEIVSAILVSVRSMQTLKFGGPWRMQQKSLTFLVLREGLLYFGFISSFLILSLIFQLQGKPGNFMHRLLNAYTMPLSGLMTARFLLHLKEWDQHISNPETDPLLQSGLS